MPPRPPQDEPCFVDANILHAHAEDLGAISVYASALVNEIAAGERVAYTYAGALADAVHKIMLSEAAMKFGRPRAGLIAWMQRHQDLISQLTLFREAADEFAALGLQLLRVDFATIAQAAETAQQHGLLTNDALIVTLMRLHGVQHLITNDDGFDHVPGITVWKPR